MKNMTEIISVYRGSIADHRGSGWQPCYSPSPEGLRHPTLLTIERSGHEYRVVDAIDIRTGEKTKNYECGSYALAIDVDEYGRWRPYVWTNGGWGHKITKKPVVLEIFQQHWEILKSTASHNAMFNTGARPAR